MIIIEDTLNQFGSHNELAHNRVENFLEAMEKVEEVLAFPILLLFGIFHNLLASCFAIHLEFALEAGVVGHGLHDYSVGLTKISIFCYEYAGQDLKLTCTLPNAGRLRF